MASGIRMSGMVSGMDTEALVQAMVSTHVAKKEKYQKAQTKLEWKQDAFKSINTKVYSLYSKVGNLRFSSAYSLKKTTVSDPTKALITASGQAINGSQSLQIKQLAKSGYLTGGKLDSKVTENSTLKDLGYTGGEATFTVRSGADSKDIKVSGDTKISDLVSQLNKAGVKASFDNSNKRLFVSAKDTGLENDFSITADSIEGLSALKSFGLSVESSATTKSYETMASYAKGSEAETKASIRAILDNLKNAYASNAALNKEEKLLKEQVAYSDAKDSVDEFINGVPEDKKKDAELLVKLLKEPANKYSRVDADGNVYEDFKNEKPDPSLDDKIKELAKEFGLITTTKQDDGTDKDDVSKLEALNKNVAGVLAIEGNTVLTKDDITAYYISKDTREALAKEDGRFAQIANERKANNEIIENPTNSFWDVKDYSTVDMDALTDEITAKIYTAKDVVDNDKLKDYYSEGATRVDAQDSIIYLNNAEYTSSTNTYEINGLTIKAMGVTKDDESVFINTDTDTQGIYDKVKDFLTEYNNIINEMNKMYNAASASKYEPLTDDQKKEMSESEVEKWEAKIKESILRRDGTIGGVITAMTSSMTKAYTVNGKSYSLASFGIQTLGFLNAKPNENYAYHIDGDADDEITSGKTDKLRDMINKDPEAVEEFMKQLATGLYSALDEKMKSTTMSSAYTIYNDKQMTQEYKDYTALIKTWENKITAMEDRYYKQYSKMETQLSKMQSATSSLSGLLGN